MLRYKTIEEWKHQVYVKAKYVCSICRKKYTSEEDNDKNTQEEEDINYRYDVNKVFGDRLLFNQEDEMLKSVRHCLVSGYIPRNEMDEEQLNSMTMATMEDCYAGLIFFVSYEWL